MSGLQEVFTALKVLFVAIDISDILEFNKKAQERYIGRNKEVCGLIRKSHSQHIEFHEFLKLVKSSCIRSCAALNNLKMELEIAIETEEFDNTFLVEIHEASRYLTITFKSLYDSSESMKRAILNFGEELDEEREAIKSDVNTCNNAALIKTISIVFRTCVSITSLLSFESVTDISAIIGGVVVSGLLVNDEDNKSRKLNRLIAVVDNTSERNSELYCLADTFSSKVYNIKDNISILVDDARKTVQQGLSSSLVVNADPVLKIRLVTKARGMIESINDLLSQLMALEVEVSDHSSRLRAEIRQKSPRSLLGL